MNGLLVVVLAVLGVVGWAIYSFFFNNKKQIERIKFDKLTSEAIITWFKQPENIELIRSNSNLICVLLKDQEAMKYANIQVESPNKACVQALFDKAQNNLKKARVIEYRELDDILKSQFSDKDMVVFT